MIPHIIHYCWLSNEPIPRKLQECIDSWRKCCPDFEIVKWDTDRFDINSLSLVEKACKERKWAYAADYIRLYALYHMGGVYLDSDVMLFNNIDELLDDRFVSGVEYHPKKKDKRNNIGYIDKNGRRIKDRIKVFGIGIQAAFISSEPGHPLLKDCMDFYKTVSLEDLLESRYTAPTVLAYHAEKYGYRYLDTEQHLEEGIHLYPTKLISHFDQYTSESIAVHFCAGSWVKKSIFQKVLSLIKNNKHLYKLYLSIIHRS